MTDPTHSFRLDIGSFLVDLGGNEATAEEIDMVDEDVPVDACPVDVDSAGPQCRMRSTGMTA
jgi:hypothetical protein